MIINRNRVNGIEKENNLKSLIDRLKATELAKQRGRPERMRKLEKLKLTPEDVLASDLLTTDEKKNITYFQFAKLAERTHNVSNALGRIFTRVFGRIRENHPLESNIQEKIFEVVELTELVDRYI